jgi:hypothetical protein
MPSAIDETNPIPYEPTTASTRQNFSIAKAEITQLQARLLEPPPSPLDTSLILAWRDEAGVYHAIGRVMVDQPDPANDGNRWLYIRVDE